MELTHLINLISQIPENTELAYVRSESKCTYIKVDKIENRLYAKTPEGKDVTFAESFLKELADKIEENVPFNTSQLLNNKGSNRAVVDSIIANTSEMYWLNKDRAKFTVWIPSNLHEAGELHEWKDMSILKESNSNCVRFLDMIVLNEYDEDKMSEDSLVEILKQMAEIGSKENSQVGYIYLFGFKYGNIITSNKYSIKSIVEKANLSEGYTTEINKAIKLSTLVDKGACGTSFWTPQMKVLQNNSNKVVENELRFSTYRSYITAIKSKPFLLLAGISGTGKSRIVRELARACWEKGSEEYMAQKPSNFEMIQVKPNWHDSSELFGYISRASGQPEYVPGEFLKFVARAWENIDVPHFLCLDEMNLAPVEQYFAEFLSVIESRKCNEDGVITTDPILEKTDTGWYFNLTTSITTTDVIRYQFNEKGISLPPNLVVVGTVNMDETTFSFSRKVLDRAMSIEMNEVDLYGGLTERYESIGKIDYNDLIGTAVEGVDVYAANKDVCDLALEYLSAINKKLEGTPFKIAYRTRNEFLLYVVNNLPYNQDEEGKELPQGYVIARALDEITSMKILSRIEGDDTKVKERLLTNLMDVIETKLAEISGEEHPVNSISLAKLKEMKEKLAYGYTSFWS